MKQEIGTTAVRTISNANILASPQGERINASICPNPLPELEGDLDLPSTERLLEIARVYMAGQDFRSSARLLERALPSLDRFYAENFSAKLTALKMLRDSYLSLNKAIEAKDCAEVVLAIFEEIMRQKKRSDSSRGIGNPAAFTRPVIRKLKTLRHGKASEYLRRRSLDVSGRWTTFCKRT